MSLNREVAAGCPKGWDGVWQAPRLNKIERMIARHIVSRLLILLVLSGTSCGAAAASQSDSTGRDVVVLFVAVAIIVAALYLAKAALEQQAAAWQQFAHDIQGEFSKDPLQVKLQVKSWTLTLDTWVQTSVTKGVGSAMGGARLRAPFVTRDAFRFRVSQSGSFGAPGQRYGEEVLILNEGDSDFGAAYFVATTDKSKAQALFANQKIREFLRKHPGTILEVQDKTISIAAGVYQLYFEHTGSLTDLDLLHALFDLFTETLNQLVVIGSASEAKPPVEG